MGRAEGLPVADDNNNLRGRKQVRLRVRKNLIVVEQHDGEQPVAVLKDPVSLRYYRLDARQRFAVNLMDGTRTLEEIRQAYERAFRPDRLSLEELEDFAAQLLTGGLAETDSPLAGQVLFQQAETQRGRALRARLWQCLWLRVPLCDPDRLLTRLLPYTRFVFTVRFALLALAVGVAAACLVVTHWDVFVQKLPGRQALLHPRTLLYLAVAWWLTRIVHEFGHGLCCKAQGGEVHEMGFMLLLLFPALYCNVSDAWQFPRKRQRLAVGAAGMYVELLLAVLAALLWWLTDAASLWHELALGIVVACSVNTLLFNANPLVRCDGYYLLSDWADLPNLSEQANQAWTVALLRWLGVPVESESGARLETRSRKFFLVFYAVASWAYRVTGFAVSLWFLHQWLVPRKLVLVSWALAGAAALAVLVWPAWRWFASLHQQRSFRHMKPLRLGMMVGLASAGIVLLALVPLPVYVEGVAVIQVEPGAAVRVTVPDCGGFLVQLVVEDGQTVEEGQILAVLTNPKLDIALQINEADQILRTRQQEDLVAHFAQTHHEDGPSETAAPLKQPEFDLEALRQQHAALKAQQRRLTLRASRGGVVLGLRDREQAGQWLDGGSELCRVGNPRALRAVFLADSGDRQLIRPGSAAHLRIHGRGSQSWSGAVVEVAQVEAAALPPQLAGNVGGDVATRKDPVSHRDQPRDPHYLVAVQFTGADGAVHPGVLGRVRIQVESQTLGWRLRRFLATTFQWGL
jgi:putative peptide zinc metalloprotease protein